MQGVTKTQPECLVKMATQLTSEYISMFTKISTS